MHPLGFKPFFDTLKSPGNLIFLGLTALMVVDYIQGCPLMTQVALIQLRIQKIDPASDHMQIFTIFGTFTRVDVWTAFIERVMIGICAVIPGFSLFRGLYFSLGRK